MPLPGGPAIPQDLLDAAEGQDAVIGDAFAEVIPTPERPYSIKVFNALLRALREASAVVGVEVELEDVTDAVTEMSPDEARMLAMLDAASRDYGAPFPVALDAIKGDAELTAITAHLMRLAADEEFKAFLDTETEDVELEDEAAEGKQMEFDFASRMAPGR